jgi:hypothetical protein
MPAARMTTTMPTRIPKQASRSSERRAAAAGETFLGSFTRVARV